VRSGRSLPPSPVPDLSVLIVNTQARDLLLRGLDAVQRELAAGDWDAEVIVLDNASSDGSVAAAEAHPLSPEVIALRHRQGKAASDRLLLERAAGRYGLLMNEDAELQPGALPALMQALDEYPEAAAVGAKLLRPDGTEQPSAWAFPSVRGALWAAIGRPGRVVQSTGDALREVDWAQSAALLVRVDAARAIDSFDPEFFVYSDEVDFERRLRDAGHTILWCPQAVVVHHEQLSTDLARASRRIVEFHRGRDRYLRKHHGAAARLLITWLTVWTYGLRAAAATVLPGHDPARYLAHARAALRPQRGEGLREAAAAFNAHRR
jgi:N-acetylglucosaminyl-diphospho-decaprenol L-rhamnosyltransferase